MLPNDLNFILNSYLKSYRNSPETKDIVNGIYFSDYRDRIALLLQSSEVTVICAEDDEDHIIGYAVHRLIGDWPLIHYVYVKHPFRGMKMATTMLETLYPEFGHRMSVVSHMPKNWKKLKDKFNLIYNPNQARTT